MGNIRRLWCHGFVAAGLGSGSEQGLLPELCRAWNHPGVPQLVRHRSRCSPSRPSLSLTLALGWSWILELREGRFLLRQQRDLAVLLTPELIPEPGGPTHLGSPESGIGARGETPTVTPTLSVLNISRLQQELPVCLQVLLRLLVMELQNAFSRPQGVWSLHD